MAINTVDELLQFARLDLSIVKVEEADDALAFASDYVEFLAPADDSDRSARVNPIRKRAEVYFATSELYERIAPFLHLTAPPKQVLAVLGFTLGCVLENTAVNILHQQSATIMTMKQFCDSWERDKYRIDTPTGWEDVGAVILKPNKRCYLITLQNGMELGCSDDHLIMAASGWVNAEALAIETNVKTENGLSEVVAKDYIGIRDTYDLQVLTDAHAYYSNGIVSHNTDFPTPDIVQRAFEKTADRYRKLGEQWAKRIQPVIATIDTSEGLT